MSTHPISDDELLLYHYRDGLPAAERERIAAALLAQPELAARLQTLVMQLDAVASIPEVPVPLQTQQRWRAALERVAANETARAPRSLLHPLRWPAWVAIAAAAIAIAFRLGMYIAAERVEPMVAANQSSRCECGAKWHLASVERQLARLSTTNGQQRAALIDAVIAQNRIYAIAAERAGDQRLAGALRAFTPILESLARNDAGNRESAAQMAQLNFELRVMQARLAGEADNSSAPAVAL
jgi:hypothetical protein